MKQPEALRLADYLSDRNRLDLTCDEAAAELRRLHQSEREGWRYADELEQERKRLNEANQAMLEALSSIDVYLSDTLSGRVKPEPETHKEWLVEGIIEARNRARAAIAKGEQQ